MLRKSSDSIKTGQPSGQVELLLALTESRDLYHCPGDSLPINSSVHQARLRSNYQACRSCPHREEASRFSEETQNHLEEIWQEKRRPVQTLRDGFRGVQWNELSFQEVDQICANLCHQLIRRPLQQDSTSVDKPVTVVMGHDSRVASLAVVDTAIRTVRDCGVQVIDIGEASAPCLRFAVGHLEADAGIHATAAGSPATHIGLDLYQAGGAPMSGESLYSLVPARNDKQQARYGRVGGKLLPFPARKAYLGSLLKHFRHVNAGRILLMCQSEWIRKLAGDLNRELSLTLLPYQSLTGLEQEISSPGFGEVLSQEMGHQSADFAVWIGEDGQGCRFFDRHGTPIFPDVVISAISETGAGDLPSAPILLGEEFQQASPAWLEKLGAEIRWRQSLRENFARGMRTSRATVGVDCYERYWIAAGQIPDCDALITLGRLLQSLSR